MEENNLPEKINDWICPKCGNKNNGQFCSKCGQKKISEEINPMDELQNLIQEPVSDNKTTAEENISISGTGEEWTCYKCGSKNSGTFCAKCGQKKVSNEINPMDELQDLVKNPILKTTIPKRHATNKSKSNTLKYVVIVGIVLVFGVFFGIYILGSDNNNSSTKNSTPKVSSTTNSSANNEKKAIVADSDLSLGGVALGYSIDQMHNILGRETSIEDNGMYKFYNYSDIQVGIKDGKVDSLVSNSSVVETKRGIHQGSNLQDVLNKYGDNYSKTDYNDLILYEYTFASDSGKNGILRFAINKSNNQVNYISVRIPDETALSSNAANEAKQVLNNYYAAITRHDMRVAYNILSADMQTHMGSLDVYADGYKTTLSDEIFDVQVTSDSGDEIAFSYILTARDKYNNGVKEQTFACTALLSKKTGSWHIVDMSAKKQSERIVSR